MCTVHCSPPGRGIRRIMERQTKIKICGLRRLEDVWFVNAARPDYAGFVVNYPKSRRNVPADALAALTRELAGVAAVGVFVDEAAETVAELLNADIIDVAQLHGGESAEYIARLKTLTDKQIIKAFVADEDFDAAAVNASPADLVLIDGGRGGGIPFDHGVLAAVTRPFILAGGLTADNVAAAIRAVHPLCVDLSSGVETDGVKDFDKIKRAVRACDLVQRQNA